MVTWGYKGVTVKVTTVRNRLTSHHVTSISGPGSDVITFSSMKRRGWLNLVMAAIVNEFSELKRVEIVDFVS